MTENPAPAGIAVAFIEAWSNKDMATVAGYLAADIVFESPKVRLTGAEAVLEAIGQFAQIVTGVSVIAALGDEERAVIMYDIKTGPFGTLRAADHLVIRDGKITFDQLVFDTYEVRKFEEAQAASE